MSITDSDTAAGVDGAEAPAVDLDSLIAEAAAENNPDDQGSEPEAESGANTEGAEDTEAEATSEVATDDGETYKVKVDGEEIEVTLDELLNGHMRHADYTRKTQALKQQQERYAAFDALDRAFADDPVGTLQSLAKSLGVTDLGFGQAQAEEAEELDPVQQRLQQVEAILAEQENARRQEAVDRELEAVKTKYSKPDLDETELLQFAIQNGITNLDMAYRAMHYGADNAKPPPAAKKLDKKRAAPKVEGGANRNVGVISGSSDKPSLEEAWNLSWREASA